MILLFNSAGGNIYSRLPFYFIRPYVYSHMVYLLAILLSLIFASVSFAEAPSDSIYSYTDTTKIIRGKYIIDSKITPVITG
jgi:hypothetical protein